MTETELPKLYDFSKLGIKMGTPRQLSEVMTALIYGPKGVGKTTVGASAAAVESMSPVVLCAFEDGTSSIGASHPDLPIFRPEDWEQALDFFEEIVNEDTGIKTVIIDTAAEAQQYIYDWSVANYGDSDGYKKWANVYEQFIKIIKALHKAQINVIVLAHDDRVKDQVAQSIFVSPYFQGNKSDMELPKIFDIMGRLTIEGEGDDAERVLQLEPSGRVVAGNRSEGRLPSHMVNPTMTKIKDALTNNPPKIIK